jgi:hypothetical protein
MELAIESASSTMANSRLSTTIATARPAEARRLDGIASALGTVSVTTGGGGGGTLVDVVVIRSGSR